MTELYINNRLCDINRDFGIRLNRQLLNPGELNTKDAQYSYSINLPPTANNHAIFNYANIEETKDKFNREYKAELIINSVRVFTGLFRLSEITGDTYKGNLYIPAVKSIKDIFGGLKLNEYPEYRITFRDFVTAVNNYNTGVYGDTPPCIFPYTLYGVLPKVPADTSNDYSDKTIWDDSVYMGMQDLPPSLNVLLILEHLFKSKGYAIGGTAFHDERLTKLYMSYKNDPGYVQPWNYGAHAQITVKGEWGSSLNKRMADSDRRFEKGVYQGANEGYNAYGCDLLDATNSKITVSRDTGSNVLYREVADDGDPDSRVWVKCQVRIPASGFYKVRLYVRFEVRDNRNAQGEIQKWRDTDEATGVQHVCCYTDQINGGNGMYNKMYEFRLLRNWGKGDFGLSNPKLNGTFYYNNMPQNTRFEGDSDFSLKDIPKYVPQMLSDNRGQQLFIDAAQDPNIVCGLSFGRRGDRGEVNPEYVNPWLGDSDPLAQIQIAKPAQSWDASIENITRLAVDNPIYKKYARIDSHDPNDADIPDEDDPIVWDDSERYKIELNGIPTDERNRAVRDSEIVGRGRVSAVVWFEAGELVTLASVSEEGRYRQGNMHSVYGWTEQEISFQLDIDPFRTDADWLKVDLAGNGTAPMNWNDPVNFDTNSINLVGFLPADMKADDFIDNVCKAFNLQLTQVGEKVFELNVKQSGAALSNRFINIDNLASVRGRSNAPLGLPSLYKLGFTVDNEEEGYETTKDDGGGEYETGVVEEKVTEQKSSFSFNWFKDITKQQTGGNIVLPLAVISKHEPWENTVLYPKAMEKRYTNQALRFWYQDGLLNDLGADFTFGRLDWALKIAKVSNELPGLSVLSYKNRRLTILTNYFTLLVNGGSHYTEVEGYLTPVQYEALNGSVMAMFNGGFYYVAEISGYDPAGRNKSKIKLIRKV
jgi:hypothetical protein